jgi:hypothetical protein
MNNERRKALRIVITKLEEARARLDDVTADEYEAFNNMPEGLQMSERGEAMEEGLDVLDEALDGIDEIMCNIEELVR